jgi:hypothetical protein
VAKLNEYWQSEGREGSPYTMALFYFGLGEGAEEHARRDLGHYYAWLGEELANMIIESAATDADTVMSYLQAFDETGADEVICFPVSTDPGQVQLLADAAL